MKVVVVGAGVVGTAAAWYLRQSGAEVVVFDRQPGAGLETSFANGGQVSPCHAEPWANPSTPLKALRWLGRPDAPLALRPWRFDPPLWAWMARFLRNCTAGRARTNIDRALRVALYSRRCLQELRAETGIAYDQKTLGILHVYRDEREMAAAVRAAEWMVALGLPRDLRSADQCVALEPALADVHAQLAGGIYTPEDESGDAHLFTQGLAALAAARGVEFRYGTGVLGFETAGQRITGLRSDAGLERADAFVLAAGSFSPLLAKPLGLRLPIVPAKGYSATIPVIDPGGAPSVSITDDAHKMVYSRLGDRLRAAGTAEFAGHDDRIDPLRAAALVAHAKGLFPRGGDFDNARIWAGLRPVTPDSVPIIGQAPGWTNLFLDTGHGTLGWTMACGSGRLIADLVAGQQPEIDIAGLGLERF